MSRSFRKTPIFGLVSRESEKMEKRKANRKLRRKGRIQLACQGETSLSLREVSNVFSFRKDGKKYRPLLPLKFYSK